MFDIDIEKEILKKMDSNVNRNCIDSQFHDWVINAAATLGEPSHNSYVSHNSGNLRCKIFNISGKGADHAISIAHGDTGGGLMMWNIVLEGETLPSQTSWTFIQVGDAPPTDLAIMNVTFVANSGDEIVYRLDSQLSQGTQDITDFTLINCTTIKGTSAALFAKDGTNDESGWDRTSGNLTYIPSTAATALLDATTHLPSSISSPSVNGGVSRTTRRTYAQMLGEYDDLQFEADIHGYVVGLDGQYPSGAGSGMELKLAALT